MKEEIWRDIDGYIGYYQISNYGRLKSLKRRYRITDKILKCNTVRGYLSASLIVDKIRKSFYIHKLVAITFLGHIPSMQKEVIDHINSIKTDNRLCNLRLVSFRENVAKDKKGCSSIYTGVSWDKINKKWRSQICIDGKTIYIGTYKNELDARKAYINKIPQIKN